MTQPQTPSREVFGESFAASLDRPFYRVAEIAYILNVTDGTVRSWLSDQERSGLIGAKIGTRWRVSRDDLLNFITRNYGK